MININIDMSLPTSGIEPVLHVTNWLTGLMEAEPIEGAVIHAVRVEQADA